MIILRTALLLIGLITPFVEAVPRQVIILRHSEKQAEDSKNLGELYEGLSTKGYERAAALSQYIPRHFGLPDFIFATQPGHTYPSFRPIMTCAPLAYNVRTKIARNDTHPVELFNLGYSNQEVKDLAEELLSNPLYEGKNIVICWDHHRINELAEGLGVDATQLNKWPNEVFDVTYKITFDNKVATLEKVPQKLMYGDRDAVSF